MPQYGAGMTRRSTTLLVAVVAAMTAASLMLAVGPAAAFVPEARVAVGATTFRDVITKIPGLTHYYPLDAVNAARDVVGTVNGTNHGATFGTNGATFDGKSYIELPDNDDFSASSTGAMTVVVFNTITNWKGAGASEYVHWMGKGVAGAHEWTFRHYVQGGTGEAASRQYRTSFYHFNPAGGLGAGSYFQDDDGSTERMVSGTVDPTNIAMWKNGVLRDTDALSGYSIKPANTNTPVRLGTRDMSSGYLVGRLRRVAFFDRKLSAAELKTLYSAQALTEGSGVTTPTPATTTPTPDPVVTYGARTGGADRYSTSVALFGAFGQVDDAVLSSGENFPDALSANYLAGRLGTGTLLTSPRTLMPVVRQAIYRAGIRKVYITGGTGAVSAPVETQIKAMRVGNDPTKALITVVRLGGVDRYATNRVINEYNFPALASLKRTVLLATGKHFADALAVGPIASHKLFPLILTEGTTLGASEKKQLSHFNPTNVVIAGGTAVVSQAIEDSLTLQGYNVLRLEGSDRTRTAAQVATWATDGIDDSLGNTGTGINAPQGFDSTTAYITTGNSFTDAVAAGPVAGAANHVILSSNTPSSLGAGIPLYLGNKTAGLTAGHTEVGTLHALGQTGAVSSALMRSAAASIGATAP